MTRLPPTDPPAGAARLRLRAATELGLNLSAWGRDYAYALRRQASGLLRRPDPQAYRQPESPRPPVLLLPGIYEAWAFMLPVANVLREQGYDVHAVVDLGYNGGNLEDMADLVDEYLRREGLTRCVLVAHSKGGLIGKLLLTRHAQSDLLLGLVTMNTPFEGSPLARALPLPALRLFLPRSPELAELDAHREVDQRIVSIYGRFDPHIPGGSRLPGARNVELGTRGHFLPLGDARVHRAVLDGVQQLGG